MHVKVSCNSNVLQRPGESGSVKSYNQSSSSMMFCKNLLLWDGSYKRMVERIIEVFLTTRDLFLGSNQACCHVQPAWSKPYVLLDIQQ
jgi:hypothetical protein